MSSCLRILVMSWLFKDPVVTMKEIMPWLLKIQLTVVCLNLTMPNQTVKNSLKAKKIKLLQINFVLEKQQIKFPSTYQPLSLCKIFMKKILELIQSYEDVRQFWDQNSPFVLSKTFFGINHCYYFHLPMTLFIVQNLKEILPWIQNYDDAPFWGPKWSIYLKKFFFKKLLMSLVSFIHAYLHAKNQSQILTY